MRNEGARCETCRFNGNINKKACRKCINREGHPGWEPAEGVKVEYFTTIRCKDGKTEIVRKVV